MPRSSFLFLLFALLLPAPVRADLPAPPVLEARAHVLYDYASNQVLVQSQTAHERISPGTLTKLMTAYVVFGQIRQKLFPLQRKLYPSLEAIGQPHDDAHMYLDHDRPVTLQELLQGLILKSADDAARALVEMVSGNETTFAELMNQQARSLGMENTHFTNATGAPDPQQYSSAYDLMLLAAALLRDFPEHYAIFGTREFQYNTIKLFNANRLMWIDPYVDGMMNGDGDAGHHLVSSAQRDGRRLIAVVLGTPSDARRDSESQKLLNYGFRNFTTVRLYQGGQTVASPRLWKGTAGRIGLGFPQGLTLTVPKGTALKLKAFVETRQPIVAPVRSGERLGLLKLTLDGQTYAEYPLVALQDVGLSNIFARGWDSIRLMLK